MARIETLWTTMAAFREAVRSTDLAILPVGSLEAHGEHLPLGSDILAPVELARRVAELLEDRVMVYPPIPYGHSWDLSVYPGTVNVPDDVFRAYVAAVGASIAESGVRRLAVFNGHGGNTGALRGAAEAIAEHGAEVAIWSWWLDFAPEIRRICQGQGHAGEDETSVLLAIDERRVDMSRAHVHWPEQPLGVRVYRVGGALEEYRWAQSGDATLATREKGEQILRVVSGLLAERLRAWKAATG
ncbi:MAG: creatininase family protein [Bacillota bacterium]|nr:creatininase family protein [Bacillota bacterium]